MTGFHNGPTSDQPMSRAKWGSRFWHSQLAPYLHAALTLLLPAALFALSPAIEPLFAAETDVTLRVLFRGEAITELAPHGKGNVYAPSVVIEGDLWRMWYGGQGRDGHDRIHYAESHDAGRSWSKRGVAIENGAANHVNDPSVLHVGAQWFMFYTVAERGTEDAIALAVSSDASKWVQRGVVFPRGAKGAWDSRLVGRPSVLHEKGEFRMWY